MLLELATSHIDIPYFLLQKAFHLGILWSPTAREAKCWLLILPSPYMICFSTRSMTWWWMHSHKMRPTGISLMSHTHIRCHVDHGVFCVMLCHVQIMYRLFLIYLLRATTSQSMGATPSDCVRWNIVRS